MLLSPSSSGEYGKNNYPVEKVQKLVNKALFSSVFHLAILVSVLNKRLHLGYILFATNN